LLHDEQIRDDDIIVPQTADGFQPCMPFIPEDPSRHQESSAPDKLKSPVFIKPEYLCIPEEIIKTFDPEFRMFLISTARN